MDAIHLIVAQNLKRLREERKLSLDALARLSGVSKSMLGQIERGDVNPTISTVWKIANGLKLPFSELLSRPENDCEVVEKGSVQPLIEDGGKFRNYPVFPFDALRRFEMYYIEIDPDGHLEAEPHPDGTQEFITVFSGRLAVTAGDEQMLVENGNSARFRADMPHGYRNTGSEECRLSMVISYSQS